MPLNDEFVCFDRYCHSLPMYMTYFDTRRRLRACRRLFSVRNVSSKSSRSTPGKKKDVNGTINLLCINLTRLFRVKKLFYFSFPAVLSRSVSLRKNHTSRIRKETTMSHSIFQSLRTTDTSAILDRVCLPPLQIDLLLEIFRIADQTGILIIILGVKNLD